MADDQGPPQTAATVQRAHRMRPIEVSDANIIAGWFQQIEDVSIFDRQMPLPINHADVVVMIESMVADQVKEKCRWFVTESLEGRPIGMAGLEVINMLHGHAVMPVFVAEPWRRTGIGIRMACMMIDLAFKQLRLHRITTVFRADNTSSEALLVRLGFELEGVSRQAWFSQGQYFDLMNLGLLVDDWNQARLKLESELSPAVVVELGPRPSTLWCWPRRR